MQQDVCDQFLQSLIHPHVCFVTSEQHCGNGIFLLFRVLHGRGREWMGRGGEWEGEEEEETMPFWPIG